MKRVSIDKKGSRFSIGRASRSKKRPKPPNRYQIQSEREAAINLEPQSVEVPISAGSSVQVGELVQNVFTTSNTRKRVGIDRKGSRSSIGRASRSKKRPQPRNRYQIQKEAAISGSVIISEPQSVEVPVSPGCSVPVCEEQVESRVSIGEVCPVQEVEKKRTDRRQTRSIYLQVRKTSNQKNKKCRLMHGLQEGWIP